MKTKSPVKDVQVFYSRTSFFGFHSIPNFNYLLEGIAIDTNYPKYGKRLLQEISDIKAILLTHGHVDHYGNAGTLARKFECPVYAHHSAIENLATKKEFNFIFKQFYGEIPEPTEVLEVFPEIKAGDYTLETVPLPGHSLCSIGYYEPSEQWLFTGDAIPNEIKKRDAFKNEDLPGTLESLKKIYKMPIKTLFTSHNGPITDPLPFLDKRIAYLDDISFKIRELSDKGYKARKIRKVLFGREKYYTYFIGGERSSMNTVLSFLTGKRPVDLTPGDLEQI